MIRLLIWGTRPGIGRPEDQSSRPVAVAPHPRRVNHPPGCRLAPFGKDARCSAVPQRADRHLAGWPGRSVASALPRKDLVRLNEKSNNDTYHRRRGSRRPTRSLFASRLVLMDAGVLLETKLHPPRVREEWVKRTELVQYLAASTAKLVLVDAPAGFGKSTLVAQWRAFPGQSRKFAWVSVDAGDNDAARLWWYIGCALQRACPELQRRRLAEATAGGQGQTCGDRCCRPWSTS